MKESVRKSFKMFPIPEERQNQLAGSLSGGEQQMLAIASSLMINPKLLMLDESSLDLAPIAVNEMIRRGVDCGIVLFYKSFKCFFSSP